MGGGTLSLVSIKKIYFKFKLKAFGMTKAVSNRDICLLEYSKSRFLVDLFGVHYKSIIKIFTNWIYLKAAWGRWVSSLLLISTRQQPAIVNTGWVRVNCTMHIVADSAILQYVSMIQSFKSSHSYIITFHAFFLLKKKQNSYFLCRFLFFSYCESSIACWPFNR